MKISFLGAAGNVTGSRHLLEIAGARILVDCGLYQEHRLKERNWNRFTFDPKSLDAVLLTHAHLDHCGLLPKLVKDGFSGPIYTTSASAEIARIVMFDSAHMQEEDAKFKARRHRREGRKGPHPEAPLYTKEDAEAVLPLFETVPYGTWTQVAHGVSAEFRDAGHILGSSVVSVRGEVDGQTQTVLFSGDIGRENRPILRDPDPVEEADFVVMESTYGDRLHPEKPDDVEALLADAVNKTVERGGNLLIPTFAVERAQEILFHLNNLQRSKRIPRVMTFLDSPMAVEVTRVFRKHPEFFDHETLELVSGAASPFDMPGLKLVRTVDTSKSINYIKGSAIILAGSGMCTGGRIKHHLIHNVHRSECMVLFVGYQAQGTLGRLILDGRTPLRMLGQQRDIRCNIGRIHGFSGHADRNEMTEWVSQLKKPPRKVFVVHGDEEASSAFAKHLVDNLGWDVHIAKWRETVELT